MSDKNYLQWLADETPTRWWHDSADLDELSAGMKQGASGATTNPILAYAALSVNPERYREIFDTFYDNMDADQRAESLTKEMVQAAARKLESVYHQSRGESGYVCGQVIPSKAADRDIMVDMGRRYHAWAPNIAVKLPVTAAGLEALEMCTAEGITVTATVSFNVPQVVAVAESHRRGIDRARKNGINPGRCFAVIMIGRIDDYLFDVARDTGANVSESDVRQAGLAISKRAYSIYRQKGYEAVLLVAALRGIPHALGVTGADLVLSIHPRYQKILTAPDIPKEPNGIDIPVPTGIIDRLNTIPEFVRSYEPDGMAPDEFITFGAVQRTLIQFDLSGWSLLSSFKYPG